MGGTLFVAFLLALLMWRKKKRRLAEAAMEVKPFRDDALPVVATTTTFYPPEKGGTDFYTSSNGPTSEAMSGLQETFRTTPSHAPSSSVDPSDVTSLDPEDQVAQLLVLRDQVDREIAQARAMRTVASVEPPPSYFRQ